MWRQLLNNLDKLPDEGSDAPTMESITPEPIHDGESPVLLQKIVTEVYFYTATNGENIWYGTNSFQDVQILGEMRLSEARKLIQSAKTRRRRRK